MSSSPRARDIALTTGINNHLRYVLPVFSFGALWASQAARYLDGRSTLPKICVALGLIWGIAATLFNFPHSLSYFNELAGGPGQAHRFLGCAPADTTLECGQDLLLLSKWLAERPDVTLQGVAYSGMAQARHAIGITCGRPPDGSPPADASRADSGAGPRGPQPGWYAVSVKEVYRPGGSLQYFSSFSPSARVGYSLLLYHISPAQAEAYHQKHAAPTASG